MSGDNLELNLANQIRETYLEANALAQQAKGQAAAAIAKAIECGQLLLQQKAALQHGGWLAWLDANLPEISEWTARRYMNLAKRAHVTDLTDTTTLRQAYLTAGILPTPEKKLQSAPANAKPWVRFTRFLDGFRLWFNKRIEAQPLEDWPSDTRRILKNELRWFADLYERL